MPVVKDPDSDSPGAKRLPGSCDPLAGDSGENHASPNLIDRVGGSNDDLKFCEYAVLNKFKTHGSRVHHVETPNGILGEEGYIPVEAGFAWITELVYQINSSNLLVEGVSGQDIANPGIPNTGGVNGDKIHSLALLATSDNQKRGLQFIDFLRSPEG